MTPKRQRLLTLMFAIALLIGGCHAILGLDDPTVEPADASASDASQDQLIDQLIVEGPKIDGGIGDGAALDGAADADAEPEVIVTYNEQWDDTTLWNYINVKDLNLGTTSFVGAVFDGRYIYFAPSNNTTDPAFAARFDTKGNGFTATDSWRFFDTAILHPDARGFEGAFFDGRFVYFVPYANATAHTGRLVRFDTKGDRAFNEPQGWTSFDTTNLNEYAKGYIGASFDGQRYAYLAPGIGGFPPLFNRPQAVAARFDTTLDGGFTDGGASQAWQFFDTQTSAPTLDGGGPRGFVGTVYTGQHVYFVPHGYSGTYRGRIIRHDPAKPFASPGSWEVFDTTAVHPDALGFQGGGFDGRYVYLSPLLSPSGQNGTVTRFDTQKPFTAAASWNAFDLRTIDGGAVPSQAADGGQPEKVGFVGTGFDGRFLYLAGNQSPAHHGWIARFDTSKPALDDPSAWSFYNANTLHPDAKGMCGAVYDGQYMYFVPCFSSVIVRFYAGYPAKLPKFPKGGSFL